MNILVNLEYFILLVSIQQQKIQKKLAKILKYMAYHPILWKMQENPLYKL